MYGGIYRAKAVTAFSNGSAQVLIPQLYGDVLVTVTRFLQYPLTTPLMGWVVFEGADSSFPVWISGDSPSFGEYPALRNVSASYTLSEVDHTLNCTTVGITITLPVCPVGRVVLVKNSTNGVVYVVSAALIDGESSQNLPSLTAMKVQSTGSSWIVV